MLQYCTIVSLFLVTILFLESPIPSNHFFANFLDLSSMGLY